MLQLRRVTGDEGGAHILAVCDWARRKAILFSAAVLLIFANAHTAWSQAHPSQPQPPDALLEEVRQLRHEMKLASLTAQRIQIALYRLQLQEDAVTRAARVAEDSRSRLTELASERKRVSDEIASSEELENSTSDPIERRTLEKEYIPQLKRNLEQINLEEQTWQTKASEAEIRLRTEQMRLDSLNALLDQLDQSLQTAGTETNRMTNLRNMAGRMQGVAAK